MSETEPRTVDQATLITHADGEVETVDGVIEVLKEGRS